MLVFCIPMLCEGLVAFEYTGGLVRKPNTLVFIGGLGDGLGTVEYLTDLITALEYTSWSVFSPILSSSYSGWGVGHLGKDIDEIARCVHQDVMHYLSCANPRPRHPVLDKDAAVEPFTRPPVDGAIMQAPVSDREAISWVIRDGTDRDGPERMRDIYQRTIARARSNPYEDDNTLDTILPLSVTSRIGYPSSMPVSSRRFLSLASPDSPEKPEEDDMFSSDLSDDQIQNTFGQLRSRGLLGSKLLVLYSGRDQSVPPWVDKELLLKRWSMAAGDCWDSNSTIIPNASHALSDDDQAEPRRILVERVMSYLEKNRENLTIWLGFPHVRNGAGQADVVHQPLLPRPGGRHPSVVKCCSSMSSSPEPAKQTEPGERYKPSGAKMASPTSAVTRSDNMQCTPPKNLAFSNSLTVLDAAELPAIVVCTTSAAIKKIHEETGPNY
ncbi:hypothetical protein CNMCM7691_009585 [Aspergillus felis]|uniref:Uncharacterized protein n=1 Tax=Aspergillus felis TaxID=1287682 RepID=A0A8H6V7E8_9EURO|nr:hypothetical protein CNMCM7691_009585 [Aspergillus felis]